MRLTFGGVKNFLADGCYVHPFLGIFLALAAGLSVEVATFIVQLKQLQMLLQHKANVFYGPK